MRFRSLRCLSAALAACVLLSAAAQAQVIPFSGNFGPGLSPSASPAKAECPLSVRSRDLRGDAGQRARRVKGFRMPASHCARGCTEAGVRKTSKEGKRSDRSTGVSS